MTCPKCNKDFSIGTQVHHIDAQGVVSPSMVCPFKPCTFHAYIRLEGWVPPNDEPVTRVEIDSATASQGSKKP